MKSLKIILLIAFVAFTAFLTGCEDDPDFTGDIQSSNQVVVQNNVFVEQISIDRPGWVIIHEGSATSPGDVISYPAYINSAGSFTNHFIQLDSSTVLTDSMEVELMLYYDDGTRGEFDSEDQPVMVDNQPVSTSILLASPMVTVANQPVTDNTVVVDEILTGILSWVAIYNVNTDGSFGDLAGFEAVEESQLTDVEVQLTDTVQYVPGNKLAAVMHLNNDPVNQFNPNDVPLVFGFDDDNLIYDSFTIQ